MKASNESSFYIFLKIKNTSEYENLRGTPFIFAEYLEVLPSPFLTKRIRPFLLPVARLITTSTLNKAFD